MNTPTKELLAAAKAVFGTGETREQMLLLRAESKYVPVEISAGRILLAALEAAEADGARLDWLEARKFSLLAIAASPPEKPDDWWSLMTDRHDHEAGTAREAIDAARKEAQP